MAPDNGQDRTLFESWMHSLKNHPAVAAALLIAAVVIGLGSFADALRNLGSLIAGDNTAPVADNGRQEGWRDATATAHLPGSAELPERDRDEQLAAALLGTWSMSETLPAPAGYSVDYLNYSFQQNGLLNWRGSYHYQGQRFPIHMSGTWRIEDATLTYVVESTNIPLTVNQGYSSSLKIVEITPERFIYLDSVDGRRKSDPRVR